MSSEKPQPSIHGKAGRIDDGLLTNGYQPASVKIDVNVNPAKSADASTDVTTSQLSLIHI